METRGTGPAYYVQEYARFSPNPARPQARRGLGNTAASAEDGKAGKSGTPITVLVKRRTDGVLRFLLARACENRDRHFSPGRMLCRPLGSDGFLGKVEEWLGRRVRALPWVRPPGSGKKKSRER